MQLGETIATYDIALALRGENGKFDVTSPTGEIYHVTCRPNHSITNMQWSGNGANPQPFLIRKVAEPVSSEVPRATMEAIEGGVQLPPVKTPFLVTAEPEDMKMNSKDTPGAGTEITQPNCSDAEEFASLDLQYSEIDLTTQQPTARVCLSRRSEAHPQTLITASCANFNEFDAEIRRLHAQLEDIRYRARKKFYQAQAIAAGA